MGILACDFVLFFFEDGHDRFLARKGGLTRLPLEACSFQVPVGEPARKIMRTFFCQPTHGSILYICIQQFGPVLRGARE